MSLLHNSRVSDGELLHKTYRRPPCHTVSLQEILGSCGSVTRVPPCSVSERINTGTTKETTKNVHASHGTIIARNQEKKQYS